MPSFIEPGTNGNHAYVGQASNNGSSANIPEILVSMYNILPEGTEVQFLHFQVEKVWVVMFMCGSLNASENIHTGMTQDLGLL